MSDDQLTMPFDVRIVATASMGHNESRVDQCSWCGLLVCCGTHIELAACPACGSTSWWRQDPGSGDHFAGPFHRRSQCPWGATADERQFPSDPVGNLSTPTTEGE